MPKKFITKDSGKRKKWDSGFVRDIDTGKPRYDLIPHEMLTRLAELMTRGAEKYGVDNWKLADSEEEINRFKQSAFRHFIQWIKGDTDEDHASAILFNVNSYEWHKENKIRKKI